MDFDFERTKLCSENKAPAMFRLYGWKPWSVSLGYNQKESDINLDSCKNLGFDLVRRPTGGRAVLHADELTYSVVCPLQDGVSAQDCYREIHILLLNGLNKLLNNKNNNNILSFEQAQTNFREMYERSSMSMACFAATAKYEIEFQGRKVVGSAQRTFDRYLLQHGSILLDSGHEQLADISNISDPERKKQLKEFMLSHSATLTEAFGRKINFEEAEEVIEYELEN